MNNSTSIVKRQDSDPAFHWNLKDLYQSDQQWEEAYTSVNKQLPEISSFQGHLGENGKKLLNCLETVDKISSIVERLYVYAYMKFHEDSANAIYQSLSNKADILIVSLTSTTSFILPEIVSIPQKDCELFLKTETGLLKYQHFLENLIRQKSHTLSAKEEAILAQTEDISSAPQSIFAMINDADMVFPDIQDEKGNSVPLTKGTYTLFLESNCRSVRKSAFDALYKTYEKQKNTLAATYYASVKKDIFYAKIRNYPSALSLALSDDNIPENVYSNLITTVHKNISLLHRYVALRKKVLNVDQLHMYDLYTPLVSDLFMKIDYETAKKTVSEGLTPLGKEYISHLKEGFEGGWIDVYENQGKRGGAYSWGTYSCHPFVLMNYNNTINSMFTLAHEMGHALHSLYTWQTQPYIYGGHKIFVAEVASTCNEALLMEHLLSTSKDQKTKLYLINYFLEQFRGTFFRQTMFAEFEKITHEKVEKGEPLTCELLNQIYHDLNVFYFGNDIIVDGAIDIEWARIPHFYNAFYVYQYATGYSAAIALSRKILSEGQPAVDRYLNFLKKGNSEYSIDLLRGAGVDMTTPQPIENALHVFEDLLTQMEKII